MRNRIIKASLKFASVCGLIVFAYFLGTGTVPITFDTTGASDITSAAEPVRTPTVEARLVETHTVEYIEETVVETEYVDVVQNITKELRNFLTIDELQTWMGSKDIRAIIHFQQSDTVIDCDDFAFEMQQKALKDGYIVSFEIISVNEYNGLFTTQLPETASLHAINLAIIGNNVFYIEPQTGETVHAANLD